jgi:TolB protein
MNTYSAALAVAFLAGCLATEAPQTDTPQTDTPEPETPRGDQPTDTVPAGRKPPRGTLRITTSTSGDDRDPDGYKAEAHWGERFASVDVPPNGTVSVEVSPTGCQRWDDLCGYRVSLTGLAPNCALEPTADWWSTTRLVPVDSGQTKDVFFSVWCVPIARARLPAGSRLAFVRDGRIHIVDSDGTNAVALTEGPDDGSPAWSPDGQRIAFTRGGWPARDIYVIEADGTITRLTTGGYNEDPAFSPDGARIAFAAFGSGSMNIRTMSAHPDGSPSTALVTNPGWDAQPSWTPTGDIGFVSDVYAYDFRFQLADLAPNCTVAEPAVRTATLIAGTLTPLEFSVACVAATGALLVTVATEGVDLDPTGYSVTVNGLSPRSIATNGSVVISSIAAGSHSVRLNTVASNCRVAGENGRMVSIVAGRSVRDTVSTGFAVSCTRVWDLAFSRSYRIRLSLLDGKNSEDLAPGWQPAWSPDGWRLAYHCGQICVTDMTGGGTRVIETGDLVDLGSWSPDGTRLAFVSSNCDDYYGVGCVLNGLFTIRADGTGMTKVSLPADVSWAGSPDWSPDGSLIAFDCYGALSGICVTAPNGEGFRVVWQSGGTSSDPSWSPDGSRIVFSRYAQSGSEITIMNADGTSPVSTGARGWAPSWTRDGSRILFTAMQCFGGSCDQAGIASIKPDGTGRIEISTDRNDHGPAARP